ncbi:MAG: chromophore lyase CpcT/CpeT [Ignavibacteria bacterium]|nr:chromophore lyase CpcT/CpeT [Ignavibacteria bacterium]
MKKLLILLALLLGVSSFSFAKPKPKSELMKLVARMEGSFSSQEQSERDTNYFDIRLHMKRIWKERTDGVWLYVEQAVATAQQKPYRQRVYHVTQTGKNKFLSEVYTMENPLRFAGDYKKDNALSGLTPDSLKSREGCGVYLTKTKSGNYKGLTKGKDCPSDLRGAKYATSEVTIYKNKLVSWDRGWGDNGEQIWGATGGGYIFKKQKE